MISLNDPQSVVDSIKQYNILKSKTDFWLKLGQFFFHGNVVGLCINFLALFFALFFCELHITGVLVIVGASMTLATVCCYKCCVVIFEHNIKKLYKLATLIKEQSRNEYWDKIKYD